jgi:hypothetical protein
VKVSYGREFCHACWFLFYFACAFFCPRGRNGATSDFDFHSRVAKASAKRFLKQVLFVVLIFAVVLLLLLQLMVFFSCFAQFNP